MAIESVSFKFTTNAKDVENQLKNIDKQIAKLQNSRHELQIKATQLTNAQKGIDAIDIKLKKLQAQKAELKIDGKQTVAAQKDLSGIERQMRYLKSTKAKLMVDKQEVKGSQTELNKVERQMTSLNGKKANLQVQQENIAEAGQGLSKVEQSLSKLNSSRTNINISSNIQKVGSAIDGVGSKMLGIASKVTLAGSAIATAFGVKSAKEIASSTMEMEKMQASLESLTGSAEAARTMFGYINDFSLNSAFSGADISSVSRNFLSIGKDVEETYTWLKRTGDVAGATGADMSGLGLVFSQVAANGKLNGQDWLQIINNGAGGLRQYIIAASDGAISQENFSDKMSDSKITAELFTKAIDLATSSGERFFKGTERQAATLPGRLSNLAESLLNIGMKIAGINKETGEVREGSIYDIISKDVQRLIDVLDKNGDKITGLAEKIEGTIISLYNRIKAFDWKSLLDGLKESFSGIKTTIKTMWDTAQPILDFLKEKITDLGGGSFAKGLGKLPEYFIKTAVGLRVVGTALKGLGAFTGVIGKLTGFNLGSLFGGKDGEVKTTQFDTGKMLTQFKNLALIAGVIGNVMLAAEAIKQVNDKVPDNLGGVAKKMGTIVLAIGAMGALVAVAGILTKNGGMTTAVAGLATVALIAVDLMVCAEALKQINSKVPSNIKTVAKKLANIGIAITAMGALAAVIGLAMVGTAGIGALAVGGGLLVIAGVAGDLILMAEAIDQINQKVPEDFSGVETKLDNITKVIEKMAGLELGGLFGMLETLVNTIHVEIITTLVETMVKLSGELKAFETAVEDIPTLDAVNERLGAITPIIEAIREQNFGTVLDALSSWGEGLALNGLKNTVEKLTNITTYLKDFARASNNLPTDTGAKMQQIQWIIKAINAVKLDNISNKGNFPSILEGVTQLKGIAEKLSELGEMTIKSAVINDRIQGIADVFVKLRDVLVPTLDGNINADSFRNVINGLGVTNGSGIVELATRLQAFLDVPFNKAALLIRIDDLKEVMSALSDFDLEGAANAGEGISIVAQLTGVLEQLAELTGEFNTTGNNYATDLLAGFDAVGLPEEISNTITKAVTATSKLNKKFTEIGKKYGDSLKKAFETAIKGMSIGVDAEITKIIALNSRLQTIGNTLGTSLASNFSTAIQNMARDVGVQIDAIQRRINSLSVSSMSVIPRTGNIGRVGYATGGEVQYRATGGVMQPKGTDTVPAMLTPGEFVMRKQAVDSIGTPFMQRLNNLDIQGAFRELTGNFNGRQMVQRSTHSVINNVHTDNRQNNAKVTQNIRGGQAYSTRRLNKYVRGLA